LAINGETICGVALSAATRLLQKIENVVDLQVSRPTNYNVKQFIENSPQPQAIYAKVHRRPKSPPTDEMSNCSRGGTPQHYPSFHVTLFKDRVYDDYGFSVSDGLYERGVYINRIRSGGPADAVGLLKPFDRIIQVSSWVQYLYLEFRDNLFFFLILRSMEQKHKTLTVA
jgi:glutamate receptor-interacting protein